MNTLLSVKTVLWPLTTALLVASIVITGSAHATLDEQNTTAQLSVTPKPCVALRKGQKCYLEVTFSWQHPKANDYCLINTTTKQTMTCWKQKANGEFSFDFQATMGHDFALRQQASTVDIAITSIPVAWVYKSQKPTKSTWRLF